MIPYIVFATSYLLAHLDDAWTAKLFHKLDVFLNNEMLMDILRKAKISVTDPPLIRLEKMLATYVESTGWLNQSNSTQVAIAKILAQRDGGYLKDASFTDIINLIKDTPMSSTGKLAAIMTYIETIYLPKETPMSRLMPSADIKCA